MRWAGPLLAAALALALHADPTATGFRNGGFEDPAPPPDAETCPDAWTPRRDVASAQVFWDRQVSHTGAASASVEGTPLNSRTGWQQVFAAPPVTRYRLRGWVKMSGVDAYFVIIVGCYDRRDAWLSKEQIAGRVPDSEWHPFEGEFRTTLDTATCGFTLACWRDGAEPVHAWFDDLEITALPPDPPPAPPACGTTASEPKPAEIGPGGALWVGGTPFFPIGIYDAPASAFTQLREAAFNTVVTGGGNSDATAARLDQVAANGLRTIHYTGGTIKTVEGREAIAQTVRRFRSHPAILAWYPLDEPDINDAAAADVEAAYAAICEADGGHPVFQTIYWPSAYAAYRGGRDILAIDPYPVAIRPLITIARSISMAQEFESNQPVWLIPQAFYLDPMWPRPPEPDELRCMVYSGVVHGAKGVLYYSYHIPQASRDDLGNPIPWNLTDTPLWPAIGDLNAQLQSLALPLLAGENVRVAVKSIGGRLQQDWRDEPAVHVLGRYWNGTIHVIAVNLAEEATAAGFGSSEVTATFEISGRFLTGNSASSAPVSLPFEGRSLVAQARQFTDVFAPYGVHVYTLEATNPPVAADVTLFRAARVGADLVALTWQTVEEVALAGYAIERQHPEATWERLPGGPVPAVGGDTPRSYQYVDLSAPTTDTVVYRLLAVDTAGTEAVVGETSARTGPRLAVRTTTAGLELSVQGTPNSSLALERAADANRGPWLKVQDVTLDAAGAGVLLIPSDGAEPTRFYRLSE